MKEIIKIAAIAAVTVLVMNYFGVGENLKKSN